MKRPEVTYIICPIHEKYIYRFVHTLYKFSEPDSFRLVLIDQIKNGISRELWDKIGSRVHLYMHPHRNLGYAKAMNEGMLHALHWQTPLICPSNDDIEIINSGWMDGIRETFEKDERIGAVIPMSPRVAGWGYGVDYYPEVLPYKEEYTQEEYNYLLKGDFTECKERLPKTFPRNMGGTIVDGAVFIMPYFRREALLDVGLMDEHYYPGSGEDVDWNARAYQKGYRVVSTSKSWVWHHWTKSKDLFASGELEDPYYKPPDHPYWNNEGDLWPEGFDVWGFKEVDGKKVPYKRVDEIFIDNI